MREALAGGTLAYVLKGYPRASEAFITSEILRLERAGIPLRLFVIKRDEDANDCVARHVRAIPDYLPPTAPVSDTTMRRWLVEHLGRFMPGLRRVARQRPLGLSRAFLAAGCQAVRARPTAWSGPRKVYVKEFLQAAALADRVLRAADVRHLHAQFAHGATTVTWLAAMIVGVPFSFTAHAKDIYAAELNPAGLLRRKLAAARFAITCTEANRQHLERLGTRTPIYCFYHGLNAAFTELVAIPTERAGPANSLRLLGVGRLVAKKGFDVFVQACRTLVDQGVPLEARIVGEDGDAGSSVRRRVAELGLHDHVEIVGAMAPAALLGEYRRATVFCLPCRIAGNGDRDGIPNVLLEAMACGLPVVTTPVSGITELVSNTVNGLLIPPNDPDATARAVLRLYRHPSLAAEMAREGQATVRERFDGDRIAAHYAAFLRRVIG
jgi:glycosyltransferase involved in cell wall biosynthesis